MKHLNESTTKRLVRELSFYLDENEPSANAVSLLVYGTEPSKRDCKLKKKTIQTLYKWWKEGKITQTALSAIVARYTYKDSLSLSYGGVSIRFPFLTPYPATVKSGMNILETIRSTKIHKERRAAKEPMVWDGSLNQFAELQMMDY